MEIGISFFGGTPYEKQVECLKNVGVSRTFIGSEYPEFDKVMECFEKNGIICETLHAPFNKINDIWYEGEAGDEMLDRLIDSVDKCARYKIPVTVVHLSSGCPMTAISEIGDKRFEKLVNYAVEKGVTVAFENQRYLENLQHGFEKNPKAGFCWDCGHESCFTPGLKFMPLFGDKLVALHISDNACEYNADNHVLPFDGKIDFEQVAKELAENGYEGTLMLEITKNAAYNGEKIYENMTEEEFYERAAASARRLADMVEKYKKLII